MYYKSVYNNITKAFFDVFFNSSKTELKKIESVKKYQEARCVRVDNNFYYWDSTEGLLHDEFIKREKLTNAKKFIAFFSKATSNIIYLPS